MSPSGGEGMVDVVGPGMQVERNSPIHRESIGVVTIHPRRMRVKPYNCRGPHLPSPSSPRGTARFGSYSDGSPGRTDIQSARPCSLLRPAGLGFGASESVPFASFFGFALRRPAGKGGRRRTSLRRKNDGGARASEGCPPPIAVDVFFHRPATCLSPRFLSFRRLPRKCTTNSLPKRFFAHSMPTAGSCVRPQGAGWAGNPRGQTGRRVDLARFFSSIN
jgi:hypothetical protein